jgi:hypothetical protein
MTQNWILFSKRKDFQRLSPAKADFVAEIEGWVKLSFSCHQNEMFDERTSEMHTISVFSVTAFARNAGHSL